MSERAVLPSELVLPLSHDGNLLAMCASDRAAVWLAAPLSVVVGVWALGSVALPFGVIGGAAAAVFGLALGGLAVRVPARGRWRKTACVGIGASCLALVIALAEVLYVVLVE